MVGWWSGARQFKTGPCERKRSVSPVSEPWEKEQQTSPKFLEWDLEGS
jgi:hypothetical protein